MPANYRCDLIRRLKVNAGDYSIGAGGGDTAASGTAAAGGRVQVVAILAF